MSANPFEGMTPEQLAVLQALNAAGYSPDQIRELDQQQHAAADPFAGMPPEQLAVLQTLSQAGYSPDQIREMDRQQHAAPAPDASLAVSPAWLAFRRSLGIQDSTDAATTQQQIDSLNQRAGLQRGDLLEQGVQQRQGIADSHEARGLFRSGERLRAQSDQQAGEGRALGTIEQSLAEGVSGLAQGLATRRAERERQSSETGLKTAYDEAQRGY